MIQNAPGEQKLPKDKDVNDKFEMKQYPSDISVGYVLLKSNLQPDLLDREKVPQWNFLISATSRIDVGFTILLLNLF